MALFSTDHSGKGDTDPRAGMCVCALLVSFKVGKGEPLDVMGQIFNGAYLFFAFKIVVSKTISISKVFFHFQNFMQFSLLGNFLKKFVFA